MLMSYVNLSMARFILTNLVSVSFDYDKQNEGYYYYMFLLTLHM